MKNKVLESTPKSWINTVLSILIANDIQFKKVTPKHCKEKKANHQQEVVLCALCAISSAKTEDTTNEREKNRTMNDNCNENIATYNTLYKRKKKGGWETMQQFNYLHYKGGSSAITMSVNKNCCCLIWRTHIPNYNKVKHFPRTQKKLLNDELGRKVVMTFIHFSFLSMKMIT